MLVRAPGGAPSLPGNLGDPAFFLLSSPAWPQYSYEGMEINNLPVELTVVWNGHFSIDNPAQNKGVEGGRGGLVQAEGGAALRSRAGVTVGVPLPLAPSQPSAIPTALQLDRGLS